MAARAGRLQLGPPIHPQQRLHQRRIWNGHEGVAPFIDAARRHRLRPRQPSHPAAATARHPPIPTIRPSDVGALLRPPCPPPQTINCLELWAKVLGSHSEQPELRPLVYPLVQLVMGAARLVATPRYFPLRLRLTRCLNR